MKAAAGGGAKAGGGATLDGLGIGWPPRAWRTNFADGDLPGVPSHSPGPKIKVRAFGLAGGGDGAREVVWLGPGGKVKAKEEEDEEGNEGSIGRRVFSMGVACGGVRDLSQRGWGRGNAKKVQGSRSKENTRGATQLSVAAGVLREQTERRASNTRGHLCPVNGAQV